jgi:hypothetical protein
MLPKIRIFEKRRGMLPECNDSIRDGSCNQQLCVENKKTLFEAVRKTKELEAAKRVVEPFIELREMNDSIHFGTSLPSRTDKGSTSSVTTGGVGAPATLRSFAPTRK